MLDEESLDEMKEMLFTNSVYLIALTVILSNVQTFMRIFALKNEYSFWKNIENNQGISLKILFIELGIDILLALYLLDNDSSRLVIIFTFVDGLVTVWKISRTFKIKIGSAFPFVTL
jgi:hypothetical protein